MKRKTRSKWKQAEILERIFEDTHGLNQVQKNEYLTNLSKNDYNTYIEYAKLCDKYYNTNNEVAARKAGDNAKEKTKSFNRKLLEKARSSYGRFRERYAGTGIRNSLKETQNARYQKGNGRNNLKYHQFAGEKSETADKHSLLECKKITYFKLAVHQNLSDAGDLLISRYKLLLYINSKFYFFVFYNSMCVVKGRRYENKSNFGYIF